MVWVSTTLLYGSFLWPTAEFGRLADMSKPVYRHLVEHKWRNDGDLDLLVRVSICAFTDASIKPIFFRWNGFIK